MNDAHIPSDNAPTAISGDRKWIDELCAELIAGRLGPTAKVWQEAGRKMVRLDSLDDPRLKRLCFVHHLQELESRILRRDRFPKILARRFEEIRQKRYSRLNAFRHDLSSRHAIVRRFKPIGHINVLAPRFDRWRACAQERLRQLFEKLPPYDPLRCPVSLFGPMRNARSELQQTRLIAWLLDPNSEHGFGSRLLQDLLFHLSEGWVNDSLVVEKIKSELELPKGRLDVFAKGTWEKNEETETWMLVIEAKVDAHESKAQLSTYEDWLEEQPAVDERIKVFLTVDGREPETAKADWEVMSFRDLAKIFQEALGDLQNCPGFQYLQMYLAGLLKDVYGWRLPLKDFGSYRDPYSVLTYVESEPFEHLVDEGRPMSHATSYNFLAFHLKYFPEMAQLCSEDGQLADLEDPAESKRMAIEVAQESEKEAIRLLDECGEVLSTHFQKQGGCQPVTTKSPLGNAWSISYWVKLANTRFRGGPKLRAGLDVEPDSGKLVAWFWRRPSKSRKGQKAEAALVPFSADNFRVASGGFHEI
ncbi:MAG: PD-(D/E)XK nuclease family protein [Gemmataceae bacterium]